MPAVTTYTKTEEVRIESGFEYNSNILDDVFDSRRVTAFSIINSRIWRRYALPMNANASWGGSPAKELLAYIELMYAAGSVLITEYGKEGIDTDKDGYKKRKSAEDMLAAIEKGELLLLDSAGQELLVNAAFGAGYSTESTIKWSIRDDSTRKFTTQDRF